MNKPSSVPPRNKGKTVCANMRTFAQTDLEARVLNALTHHLMDPEALAVFCETYADERNRLRREAEGARENLERTLGRRSSGKRQKRCGG